MITGSVYDQDKIKIDRQGDKRAEAQASQTQDGVDEDGLQIVRPCEKTPARPKR